MVLIGLVSNPLPLISMIISQTVHEDAQSASASSTLPNAFEVLMASQKTASFDDLSLPESLSCVVVRDHRCGDVIEALYIILLDFKTSVCTVLQQST